MGIIKRGILGGFSKKVANVVGSSWKGIAYMRALPLSVANPNTPAQQEERSKFKAISQFASLFLGQVIQPLWNKLAEQMSGYNLFVRDNINAATIMGGIVYSDIMLTKGTVGVVDALQVAQVGSTADIEIDWSDNSGTAGAMPTDIFCVATVVVGTSDVFVDRATGATRADGNYTTTVPVYVPTDNVVVYVWFERDGAASNSSNGSVTMS